MLTAVNAYFKPFALLWASATAAASLTAQIKYEIIIPEVYGMPATFAQDQGNRINQRGETLINRIHSFAIWQADAEATIVDVRPDTASQLARVSAADINTSGQAVGARSFTTRTDAGDVSMSIPFYWDRDHGVVSLDELAPASPTAPGFAYLSAINDHGAAIGVARRRGPDGADLGYEGFVWSFETGKVGIPALSSSGERSLTSPRSINDAGTVVGIYHRYGASPTSYFEAGFVFDSATGARSLETVDAAFFGGLASHSARDVSDNGFMVGERGQIGYFYDLRTGIGVAIKGAEGDTRSTRAFAVNDLGVVAGYATVGRDSGKLGYQPLLWTAETGSVNLLRYLTTPTSAYVPAGLDSLDVLITPKAINERGAISARLDAQSGPRYQREIVLSPVLEFAWTSVELASENGVSGLKCVYDKTQPAAGTLPADAIGLELEFVGSSDLKTWSLLRDGANGIRLVETEEAIELFAPLSEAPFIAARLADEAQ